ncbi:hypothetical protein [Neorhizobium galegae]|uniref:hypothetical protein n=1 Tax=Neorhizobium galegae TaxID=399 RepID=UPI0006210E56|nr:hypothetical protein [Neorhizobium galegae]UIK08671.1 hypothetical protein LZK81_24580 [Neorhizobium galegae]CDZ72482.1 Hypothetical protein NGAL_HAMBI2610_41060 [Neorhizobium galegae bv. orientalis]
MTITLTQVRDIGWSFWDPIGLKDTDCPRDEYDSYIRAAVDMLQNGQSSADTIDFLVTAETEYIGLSPREDTLERATRTVEALVAIL